MAGNVSSTIPVPRVPVVDLKTGMCTIPWYQYFVSPQIANLSLAGATTDDLAQGETNLYFSSELSYAATKVELRAGSNITLSYDDIGRTITISSSAGGGVADNTAQIGLTRVEGTSPNAMRSDGAPPLNQGISPTWTGSHTFNNLVKGTITYADLFYLQATR